MNKNMFSAQACIAELIGTFFLALAALISGMPAIVGVTLGIFVFIIGAISGCHLNPAVSFGLTVTRRVPIVTGLSYIIAQLIGAGLAFLAATFTGYLAPHYSAGSPLLEFLGFGLLMLTVVTVSAKNVPQAAGGLAIGGALAAGLIISRGILNPAIALVMGQALSPAVWATLLSGIFFCLLYRLYEPDKKLTEPDTIPETSKQQVVLK